MSIWSFNILYYLYNFENKSCCNRMTDMNLNQMSCRFDLKIANSKQNTNNSWLKFLFTVIYVFWHLTRLSPYINFSLFFWVCRTRNIDIMRHGSGHAFIQQYRHHWTTSKWHNTCWKICTTCDLIFQEKVRSTMRKISGNNYFPKTYLKGLG